MLSYAAAGIVLSLVVTVTIVAVGTAILAAGGDMTLGFADLADVLWRNLVLAALFGALGVGIGALVRNQVVAIVGLIVFSFVIEPAILGLVPEVGRFGPTAGAPSGVLGSEGFSSEDELLAPGPAPAVMVAWVGTAFAAGAALLLRRDLT